MYSVRFFSFGIERTRIFKSFFPCRFHAQSIFIYDRSFTSFLSDSDIICFESHFTIMPRFWAEIYRTIHRSQAKQPVIGQTRMICPQEGMS